MRAADPVAAAYPQLARSQRPGGVQVGEGDRVHSPGYRAGVAQGHRVQVAGPERALPAAVAVVRLGHRQRRVRGRERAGPVPGLVRPGHAEPDAGQPAGASQASASSVSALAKVVVDQVV